MIKIGTRCTSKKKNIPHRPTRTKRDAKINVPKRIKPTRIYTPDEVSKIPLNIVPEKFEIPHISVIKPLVHEIITVGNLTIKGSDVMPVLHERVAFDTVSNYFIYWCFL